MSELNLLGCVLCVFCSMCLLRIHFVEEKYDYTEIDAL